MDTPKARVRLFLPPHSVFVYYIYILFFSILRIYARVSLLGLETDAGVAFSSLSLSR